MLEAQRVGCEVFPVGWFGGDKSAKSVKPQGLNFGLNAVDVKAALRQR